ncbi:MAG: pseudouridine synthase [Burkholderiales bacterium]|nr:pseudouridine synthase [Burkholderiales bacterium]
MRDRRFTGIGPSGAVTRRGGTRASASARAAVPAAPTKAPARLIAFNKPFGVVCQFTHHPRHPSLADYIRVPGVYAAGRLDADSEGLLLLTSDGALQHRITAPGIGLEKCYWAQVEGDVSESALTSLRRGIDLGDFVSRPCKVRRLPADPSIAARDPPIRERRSIPTCWLELRLTEGKNRQVRRMTAAVGHPTLRLLRRSIGPYDVVGLEPGNWRDVDAALLGRAGAKKSGRT